MSDLVYCFNASYFQAFILSGLVYCFNASYFQAFILFGHQFFFLFSSCAVYTEMKPSLKSSGCRHDWLLEIFPLFLLFLTPHQYANTEGGYWFALFLGAT